MGGGTPLRLGLGKPLYGLSPRGRGNHRSSSQPNPYPRSIPAWAGEPDLARRIHLVCRVYPRVGGGTPSLTLTRWTSPGLSPRGRGNPVIDFDQVDLTGSIPAWAGEPSPPGELSLRPSVYPRVGGGTGAGPSGRPGSGGLSPRGRGNHLLTGEETADKRSIPAWAGEPTPYLVFYCARPVYPRVGGGTRRTEHTTRPRAGLSPRGRGNLTLRRRRSFLMRSIPAWAGEPQATPGTTRTRRVYPRVGGGTNNIADSGRSELGLSPRGRGNLCISFSCRLRQWSIPAWAGEPQEGPSQSRT